MENLFVCIFGISAILFLISLFIWLLFSEYINWWEFFNPAANYYHFNVNWFGAIVISFIWTILCPTGAIGYWFCCLCTIGRE